MAERTKAGQIDYNGQNMDDVLDSVHTRLDDVEIEAGNTYEHPDTHDISMITNGRSAAQITAEIAAAIASLSDTAPETLNTLNELAGALGDDPNFATTVTNLINSKSSSILINDVFSANTTTLTINNAFIEEAKCTVDVYPQGTPQGDWSVDYVDGTITITSDTTEASNINVLVEVRKVGV